MHETVDHLVPISADQASTNELTTLHCLHAGLTSIARYVADLERSVTSSRPGRRVIFTGFGSFDEETENLLPCMFHWFGTSIYNYARLVGFIGGLSSTYTYADLADPKQHKTIRKHCDNYVASVPEMETITTWRNKVGAHFAITDPRTEDSAAALAVSAMSPVSFNCERLWSSPPDVVVTTQGAEAQSRPWSITGSYAALAPRWWPTPPDF